MIYINNDRLIKEEMRLAFLATNSDHLIGNIGNIDNQLASWCYDLYVGNKKIRINTLI